MFILVNLVLSVALFQSSNCCTEIFLKSKDNTVVVGRSMEMTVELDSHITVNPNQTLIRPHQPTFCSSSHHLTWYNKYDVICIDALNDPNCPDGMNSEGLSFASSIFSGYTKYDDVSESDCGNCISNLQLGYYILGMFKSTDEVRKAYKDHKVPKVFDQILASTLYELHYSVIDSTGDGLVIEYTRRGVRVHNNTVHVLTNSPPYGYQKTNLNNYLLDPSKVPDLNIENIKPRARSWIGQLGMPGDYSSVSRFVRTAVILNFSRQPKNADAAVNLVTHIMNNVDIPFGSNNVDTDSTDINKIEKTQWITVKDLTNRILYFRTYDNLALRKVDMRKIQPGKKGRVTMKTERKVQDITNSLYA